jgi:hypothetical protein
MLADPSTQQAIENIGQGISGTAKQFGEYQMGKRPISEVLPNASALFPEIVNDPSMSVKDFMRKYQMLSSVMPDASIEGVVGKGPDLKGFGKLRMKNSGDLLGFLGRDAAAEAKNMWATRDAEGNVAFSPIPVEGGIPVSSQVVNAHQRIKQFAESQRQNDIMNRLANAKLDNAGSELRSKIFSDLSTIRAEQLKYINAGLDEKASQMDAQVRWAVMEAQNLLLKNATKVQAPPNVDVSRPEKKAPKSGVDVKKAFLGAEDDSW